MFPWCLLGVPGDSCSFTFYHTKMNNTEKETQLTWNRAAQRYGTWSTVAPCPLYPSGYTGINSSTLQFELLRKVIWGESERHCPAARGGREGREGRGCGADNLHCNAVGLHPVRRRPQGCTGCCTLRNLLSSCHSCSSPTTSQPKHSSPPWTRGSTNGSIWSSAHHPFLRAPDPLF